jgi:uncharacterized membrane protein YgcG
MADEGFLEILQEAFMVCGLDEEKVVQLVENERLESLSQFAGLEDEDIRGMAKANAGRTEGNGKVVLTMHEQRSLIALLHWCKDRLRRGLILEGFDDDQRVSSMVRVRLTKEKHDDPSVSELGKFDPDLYDIHEQKFLTFVSRTYGVRNCSLSYIARDRIAPTVYYDEEHRRMYEIKMEGMEYERDNNKFFDLLKAWLSDSPGYTWIRSYEAARDGRKAWLAFTDHYNGDGEKNNRTVKADADIAKLHYSNERALPWNKFSERLSNAFKIVDKDPARRYTAERKRDILLDKIKIDHKELAAAKLFISELPREPEDTLFERCINKFGTYVSRAFQNQKADEQNTKRRRISATNTGRGGRQGRGRGGRGFSGGRGGRFGRGGGHGRGRGGDFKSDNVSFNGIDCSDIHRDFSADEWQKLGPVGRKFIHEQREWKKNNGGRGNQRSVNAVNVNDETSVSDVTAPTTNNSNGQRGTQNGRGFGRGAQKK